MLETLHRMEVLLGSRGGICTPRSSGYEPDELLLLYPAIQSVMVAGTGIAHGVLLGMNQARYYFSNPQHLF